MITDKLIVSGDVDSSVMDPETLRFCTTEQMRKVITKVIEFHSNHTIKVTASTKFPDGKRRLGTLSLDHEGNRKVLIEDLIVEMQRVLGLDLKTRVDKAYIASSNAAQQSKAFAEGLDSKVAELIVIESDRLRAEAELIDGKSGRVQMIRGISGLSHADAKAK